MNIANNILKFRGDILNIATCRDKKRIATLTFDQGHSKKIQILPPSLAHNILKFHSNNFLIATCRSCRNDDKKNKWPYAKNFENIKQNCI